MKKTFYLLLVLLALSLCMTSCGLAVARPEAKKGEFDFSITYELNGEEQTFSALYVCEFDGTSWTLEGGDYARDWNSYTVGDYEGDTYSATIGKTEDGGDIILFFGVYPAYFMGDATGERGAPEPSLYISYPENEYGEIRIVNDPGEVEQLYGAKIIRYEYAEPIENTFKVFGIFEK